MINSRVSYQQQVESKQMISPNKGTQTDKIRVISVIDGTTQPNGQRFV